MLSPGAPTLDRQQAMWLVAELEDGKRRLAEIMLRRPAALLSFWAFDLQWLDRGGTHAMALRGVSGGARGAVVGPFGVVSRYPGTELPHLLAACVAHDVEGVVLKWLNSSRSRYYPGERRRCWLKVSGTWVGRRPCPAPTTPGCSLA
jgi:hypothetical protein